MLRKGVIPVSKHIPGQGGRGVTAPSRPGGIPSRGDLCPSWCVAPHGLLEGEEDWVHVSEPLPLAVQVLARICMTVDPTTLEQDGPHVLIGSAEFTPDEVNDIGLALQALAAAAAATTPRATL